MKTFYGERGIDICKDAVSLPGVSLQYLLRGIDSKSQNKLYAPGEEAYKHLKAAVSGGPSIVFTIYHEAGITRIRSHEKKQQLNPASGYWGMMQMHSISAQC